MKTIFAAKHPVQSVTEAIVPCNGCQACCTNELLILHPEHGDRPGDYLTKVVRHPFTGEIVLGLQQKDNGDCIYLGERGCTIHERRPAMCREFDCRRFVEGLLAMPRAERRRIMREGHVTKDVVEAGKARLEERESVA